MKKILNVYLISILFLSLNLYGRYSSRYELKLEYKLVQACMYSKSFGGVTTSVRDECISRVLDIEKQYSERALEALDRKNELEDLFGKSFKNRVRSLI